MSLVIAGTFKVPPESREAFRPHMLAMLQASRAEDGCQEYAYAFDVAEPGLVRVFEVWRGLDDLEAHAGTSHMARWRDAWPRFGVCDRDLTAYEVESSRPI
jgi:quinol monooxygenase YgiN